MTHNVLLKGMFLCLIMNVALLYSLRLPRLHISPTASSFMLSSRTRGCQTHILKKAISKLPLAPVAWELLGGGQVADLCRHWLGSCTAEGREEQTKVRAWERAQGIAGPILSYWRLKKKSVTETLYKLLESTSFTQPFT